MKGVHKLDTEKRCNFVYNWYTYKKHREDGKWKRNSAIIRLLDHLIGTL